MIKKVSQYWRSISEKHPLLLFYAITLLITLLYYYHILLFVPPQSVHRWRQTDSASITLNLYQHGLKFFKPEVHSLTSDDHTTGYAAAEAPLLYFLIALLYKIFGAHDAVYRLVNTLIFLIGLGALFRTARYFLDDFMLAASIPLLVFVSPVTAYYGNNFLTDSTALALVFVGYWQFTRYLETKRPGFFLMVIVFFTLAGLLKATMALNLFVLLGLILFRYLKPAAFWPIFGGLAVIVAWYAYAIWFNRVHDSATFLTTITPFWQLTPEKRQAVTRFILDRNLTMYYSLGMWTLLVLAFLTILLYFKRLPGLPTLMTLMLTAGGMLYVMLYWSQFQYHDYYLMVLFGPFAFILLSAFLFLRSRFPKFTVSWYFRLMLLAFLVVNVGHARAEMKLRYYGWKREYPVFEDHFTIRPYLRTIGIQPGDRVISMPDYTNCYTLYLMNQPGNTLGDVVAETPERIRGYIEKGARYLVVNDTTFLQNPLLKDFTHSRVGTYGQISIFRLDSFRSAHPR